MLELGQEIEPPSKMSEQTISESSFSAASYYSDSSENFDSSYSSSSTSPLCPLTTIIEPIFNIEIINVHGRSVTITVDSSWTVERLKKDYAQRFGTVWHFWYMMYMGKCLQNPDKLIKYNIKEGKLIHIFILFSRSTSRIFLFIY